MNVNGKRIVILLLILIIVVEVVTIGVLLYNEGFSYISRIRSEKEYIIHEKELVPREELTTYLVDDEKLFLFYDYTGLVNVYTLDGDFLYGIQFQTGNNGYGDITYVDIDNCLYIYSRMGVVFAFDERTLSHVFTISEDKNEFHRIEIYMTREKNHSFEMDTYYYDSMYNQIYKTSKSGEKTIVIDLPQKNQYIYPLGMMIGFTVFGFCAFLQNKQIPWPRF